MTFLHKSSDKKEREGSKEKVRRVNWIALEYSEYINYLLKKLDKIS